MDSKMNPAHSVDTKPSERIAEIGGLVAEALMRLHLHKSSVFAAEFGESSLPFMPDQSGDAKPVSPEVDA
jgi:hypothetical protein